MRPAALALLLASAGPAAAQTPSADPAGKAATVAFIAKLYDPETGGYRVQPGGPPSLRACNGAVKALKVLGEKPADEAKTRAFVLKCFNGETGEFSEPGQKFDLTIHAVGILIASELGVKPDDMPGALKTLEKRAKTFEDARMAAAAVEAVGLKNVPFPVEPWLDLAKPVLADAAPRAVGSVTAMTLRLGQKLPEGYDAAGKIDKGQLADGGWGKPDGAASDLETCYRVMRSLHMLGAKPANAAGVTKFVGACRNPDGGYGVKPGEKSTLSGVYYAVLIEGWLAKK